MTQSVQTKADVIVRLTAVREKLREMGVSRIGIFGSFAHSTPTAESDVDLLVEFQPGRLSFDSFMDLHFFLEELLGRKIDLVTPRALSRHIAPQVLQEVEDVLIAA